MNQDTLNMEVRKFLKKVGISSQREIEHAVLKAFEQGDLVGNETLKVHMTLSMPELAIQHKVEGEISLE